jgi:hypothetical protein
MRYRTIFAAISGLAAFILPFAPSVQAATSAQAAAAGQIQFRLIQYNTPGSDLPVTNAKLNQEFVTLKNTGTTSRDLTGWTIEDLAGHVYTFGHFTLKPGWKVVIHTGKGANSSANRYWGRGYYVWNNTGDKAQLHNAAGRWKDSCSWGNGPGSLYC